MTPLLTGVFASQISGHLTPAFTPSSSYDAITSYTVGSGGISSITFSGIPADYKHLQIRASARFSGGDLYHSITFNSQTDDNANNRVHHLVGNGSTVSASQNANYAPEVR